MKTKKLAIVGSRTFNNYNKLKNELEPYKDNIGEVISGGARGADSLARRWAKENNIMYKEHLADWDLYGKKAGYIRNKKIIKECDGCVAFWDGISKGTKHSIELCEQYNKPVKIIRV